MTVWLVWDPGQHGQHGQSDPVKILNLWQEYFVRSNPLDRKCVKNSVNTCIFYLGCLQNWQPGLLLNIGCHDILLESVEPGNVGNTIWGRTWFDIHIGGILHVTTWPQLVDPMVDHRIPEKFKALYVLIFIHVKMTLEELVQQLEAVFLAIRSAYSDVAFQILFWQSWFSGMGIIGCLPRGSFPLRSLSIEQWLCEGYCAVVYHHLWKMFF